LFCAKRSEPLDRDVDDLDRRLRTSPRSNLNLADIETLPSIGRDIKDIVRTTPFATVDPTNNDALSIGGNNGSTTYSGTLSGGGSLTKNGTGTLTLSASNTYSGLTTVSGGTLAGCG
jgi:autotransporter-associated beta strand protein